MKSTDKQANSQKMVVEMKKKELIFEAVSDEISKCVFSDSENPNKLSTEFLDDHVNENGDHKFEEARQHFTLKIYKTFQISIFKPLILLKLALFFWFGGGSSHLPFIIVYLKQLGITISEISFMYMMSLAVQMMQGTLSGIVADKTGRPKAVLVANILIVIITLSCLLFFPKMNEVSCSTVQVNVQCSGQDLDRPIADCKKGANCSSVQVNVRCSDQELDGPISDCKKEVNCSSVKVNPRCSVQELDTLTSASNATSKVKLCGDWCHTNITLYDDDTNFKCHFMGGNLIYGNISCRKYNDEIVYEKDTWRCTCELISKYQCWITFISFEDSKCASEAKKQRIILLVLASIIVILFMTSYSVCFSFLDVTAICLIQRHGKDFGQQRVSSILGQLVFSSFTGFIVQTTARPGEADNYATAFYITIILTLGTLLSVLGLEVHLKSPGKKMWRNSLTLLKNPDAMVFFLILYVLGTCYTFTNHYTALYLKELNASSILLGTMTSIGGLYGIPFLYTSNWWIKRIGHTNLFLLALLGYTVQCFVCSALRNPWWILALKMADIFTYHLLWVAVVTYSHLLATEGLTATVIALAGIMHYGIGRSSASLIGGQVMAVYDGKTAFRVLGYLCSASAFLYFAYLIIKRVHLVNSKKKLKNKINKRNGQCNEEVQLKVTRNHLSTAMELNSHIC